MRNKSFFDKVSTMNSSSISNSGSINNTNITTGINPAALKVLKNTYRLVGLTLIFSALMAYLATTETFRYTAPISPLFVLLIYFGLLFAVSAARNSSLGIVLVFILTGFLGFTLGPIINYTLSIPNGGQILSTAIGGTGLIFLGLSAYVNITKKDFSFARGFVVTGIIAAFILSLAAMIFQLQILALAVSAMFMMLSSMLIMVETSDIIHNRETNYIMATVTIYVSLYNIFISLLHLLLTFRNN